MCYMVYNIIGLIMQVLTSSSEEHIFISGPKAADPESYESDVRTHHWPYPAYRPKEGLRRRLKDKDSVPTGPAHKESGLPSWLHGSQIPEIWLHAQSPGSKKSNLAPGPNLAPNWLQGCLSLVESFILRSVYLAGRRWLSRNDILPGTGKTNESLSIRLSASM